MSVPTSLPSGLAAVFSVGGPSEFTGERGGALELAHDASLALANGTIALTFTADDVSGVNGLFSKDGKGFDEGGQLTATLRNGWIEVRQQSDSASETLRIKDVPIGAGETHHLAVSFGEGGLKVYIDGQLAAAEPEFTQGLELNTRELVIGASATHRADDDATPRNDFDGTISDLVVYDGGLTNADAIALAAAADPSLGAAAELSALSEDLLPAFAQLHHASDTLKALATAYGLTPGGLPAGAATLAGGDAAETLTGGAARDAIFAGLGDDSVDGAGGDDILQGHYGNDTLLGGSGNDVLDGGHGEDTLSGGDGDDLIVSQADGREPYLTADPDRDEGDPFGELDPATGKLYPDQPIPADDLLIGGGGADTFYFQTLINAKQRFIEEHTKDDGTIRWHKVAGENDNIHDHWVEHIGHDVILDFSKDEGDRIVIEGHTTKIAGVTHGDADGDGIVDHSVIALYSDQGRNGGAHNDDLLGDITVYGDLVTEADIETTAKPAYGIVHSIADLDEALAPVTVSPDTGPIAAPASTGTLAGADLLGDAEIVFGVDGAVAFDGDRDGALAIDHTSDLALGAGTISFSFEANSITGRDALFSKDAKTKLDGGHTTAFVEPDGDLKVRLQSATDQVWLKADGAVAAGQDHHVAITFGADGAQLYLDGTLMDTETAFTQDWVPNQEVLLIGANGWASPSGEIGRPSHAFDGEIRDFAVVNAQLDATQIAGLYQAHIDDWF